MPYLFDHVILAPCHNDFIFYDLLRHIGKTFDLTDDFFTQQFYVKLVNINLAAPFFIHMSTAFWMSVVTAMPYIFLKYGVSSIPPFIRMRERACVKHWLSEHWCSSSVYCWATLWFIRWLSVSFLLISWVRKWRISCRSILISTILWCWFSAWDWLLNFHWLHGCFL